MRRDGDEVRLTPMEFKLLRVLLRNRGRLVTHRALLEQVWGPAYIDARETLRAHIANLRRKIEPTHGGRLIHTNHGVGYHLVDTTPRRDTSPAWRQVIEPNLRAESDPLGCARAPSV